MTVCSPAQPKPSGHYFPGQWFSALPLKPPWAWAQLLHSAPTHFHLPEVHSPSLLALPNAWIYLPVNKTVSQPPRLALILSPACSSPGHHPPVSQDPRAPSSALRGTQAEGPPGLWVHFSPGHISKCTKHGRGPITWEGGNCPPALAFNQSGSYCFIINNNSCCLLPALLSALNIGHVILAIKA